MNHLNDFKTITSKLNSLSISFEDEIKDLLILQSLLEIQNSLLMIVNNIILDSCILSFGDVNVILNEDMQRTSIGEIFRNMDLTTKNKRRQMERGKGQNQEKS